MEATRRQRGNAGRQRHPANDVKLRQSSIPKAFLKTDRVWDDAAKKEWADDVERRLREVTSGLDPRPMAFGYAIQLTKTALPSTPSHATGRASERLPHSLGDNGRAGTRSSRQFPS